MAVAEPAYLAPPVRQPARRRDEEPTLELERDPTPRRNRWPALAPVLFLAVGLSVTLACDLVALVRNPAPVGGGPAAVDDWSKLPQLLRVAYHDREEEVHLALGGSIKPGGGPAGQSFPARWEPSMRFGLELADPDTTGRRKRLTYKENGTTNNTVLRLDGRELIFGERPFRRGPGDYLGSWPGRWLEREARVPGQSRDARRSVWVFDEERVQVTQTVGLVPGSQSRKFDTCLVHYRIDNKDGRSHFVGLRFLLDTFIGGNDGVPFLIPGRDRLCDDQAVFATPAEVPDFIQARESADLRNPGIIALIQFRVPGVESPSRVTLGAWPQPSLGVGCKQEKTMWDVPVFSIKQPDPADSAVVMYWNPVEVPPGRHREVAFAYGLGSVSAGEGDGQLGLSVAGSFAPHGEFTLTAEVRNPRDGQTLTLTLPEGFELVAGGPTQRVPVGGPAGAVTWKVRSGQRAGAYTLGVKSSTGVSQTQKVDIKVRGIFGN